MSGKAYEECGHLCLRGSDVGVSVPWDPVAYPHPGCPVHGHCEKYVPGDVQSNGHRPCANCLAYEDEHQYRRMETRMPTPGENPGEDACPKCGKPMTLFDGTTWAHSNVFDMLVCAEVKAVPGGPAKISSEDFAARMAERSRHALETKEWGTT